MQSAFMCYFEHLAKLSRIANKQTLFLAHVLYRMDFDPKSKQYVVSLSAFDKKSIISDIGSDTTNALSMASHYLTTLCKAGLLRYIGDGAYIVDPMSFSIGKYVPKQLRRANSIIYETRIFKDDGVDTKAYIITENGEKIDLA